MKSAQNSHKYFKKVTIQQSVDDDKDDDYILYCLFVIVKSNIWLQ